MFKSDIFSLLLAFFLTASAAPSRTDPQAGAFQITHFSKLADEAVVVQNNVANKPGSFLYFHIKSGLNPNATTRTTPSSLPMATIADITKEQSLTVTHRLSRSTRTVVRMLGALTKRSTSQRSVWFRSDTTVNLSPAPLWMQIPTLALSLRNLRPVSVDKLA